MEILRTVVIPGEGVPQKIKAARKALGLTSASVANSVGIVPSYLSQIERDLSTRVSEDVIRKLEVVLNVTLIPESIDPDPLDQTQAIGAALCRIQVLKEQLDTFYAQTIAQLNQTQAALESVDVSEP